MRLIAKSHHKISAPGLFYSVLSNTVSSMFYKDTAIGESDSSGSVVSYWNSPDFVVPKDSLVSSVVANEGAADTTFHFSNNSGRTFTLVYTQEAGINDIFVETNTWVWSNLEADLLTPNVLWMAATDDQQITGGNQYFWIYVYFSTDYGATWNGQKICRITNEVTDYPYYVLGHPVLIPFHDGTGCYIIRNITEGYPSYAWYTQAVKVTLTNGEISYSSWTIDVPSGTDADTYEAGSVRYGNPETMYLVNQSGIYSVDNQATTRAEVFSQAGIYQLLTTREGTLLAPYGVSTGALSLFRSTDGTAWNTITLDEFTTDDVTAYLAMNYNNMLLIPLAGIVGQQCIFSEDDGLTWTATNDYRPQYHTHSIKGVCQATGASMMQALALGSLDIDAPNSVVGGNLSTTLSIMEEQ